MKLRTRIFPNNISDCVGFVFIICVIPLFYWADMFLILPDRLEPGTLGFVIHLVFGTFLMFNITGNLVATVVLDTSIKGVMLLRKDHWKFCADCESTIPPRCWHCKQCNVCILKRDHHCVFFGCCIGHFNHRYFIMFLLYFFVGSCYSAYLNMFYVWDYVVITPFMAIRVIFPLAIYVLGIDKGMEHCMVILCVFSIVGVIVSGLLLYVQLTLLFSGRVTHERNLKLPGLSPSLKYNVMTILGRRWFLTWLSPFVQSKLIHDGINWDQITKQIDVKYN